MANYSRRGKGYSVRWRNPGEKNPRRYQVPDLRTAKALNAEACAHEARGETWVPPKLRVDPATVQSLDDLAISWLVDKRRTATQSTIRAYTDSVERFIDFVGTRTGCSPTLVHFERDHVRAFDASMLARGLSVSTRRARVAAVKAWAGWLEAEYPDDFRAAPVRAVAMPRAPAAKALALSWGEVDAVIDEMTGHGQVAATIGRCTGLRRGEVVSIRWDDLIAVAGGQFRLHIRDETTKGGRSGRTIPIAPVLAEYLAQYRHSLLKLTGSTDLIVPIRDYYYGVLMTSALRAAVAKQTCRADVLKVRSSTHLLRKAFVTNLRRAGADADAVEHLIGHKLAGVRAHYLDLEDLMLTAVQLVPPLPTTAA